MKLQRYFRTVGKKAAAAGSSPEQMRTNASCGTNQVLQAVLDDRFHFRTIPSIASETGMPEQAIRSILEKHSEDVRRAPLEDSGGNALYTHRSRRRTVREILAETRAFLEGPK